MIESVATAIQQLPDRTFWIGLSIATVLAVFCLYLSFKYFWRYRIMEDMPTATIRSAAQGYNEFEGITELLPGEPIISPLSRLPCVWYEYKVEEKQSTFTRNRSQTSWSLHDSGVSDNVFSLVGKTGRAIVDPDDADVIATTSDSWYGSTPYPQAGPRGFNSSGWLPGRRYRYSEKRINEGDSLYVLGHFTSLSAVNMTTKNEQIQALLQLWKSNPKRLLTEFDENNDGHLDDAEWNKVVLIAKKQIERELSDSNLSKVDSLIEKPRDSRKPYILSAKAQSELITRFQLRTMATVAVFFALGTASVWAFNIRL
jgi:hypothetical protein